MRNFLYNKSDILIAVIIIAVAAIIIWTRIGAIMDSSGETGKDTSPTTAALETDTPPADNGTSAPAVADPNAPDTPDAGAEPLAAEATPTPAATEETDAVASDEVVKFKIELGASSGSVAEDLEAAGIIKAADFIKEIKAQDKETKIKVGTFKLKPSMSAAEIVNKVTN